jgi:hypothetical protein
LRKEAKVKASQSDETSDDIWIDLLLVRRSSQQMDEEVEQREVPSRDVHQALIGKRIEKHRNWDSIELKVTWDPCFLPLSMPPWCR